MGAYSRTSQRDLRRDLLLQLLSASNTEEYLRSGATGAPGETCHGTKTTQYLHAVNHKHNYCLDPVVPVHTRRFGGGGKEDGSSVSLLADRGPWGQPKFHLYASPPLRPPAPRAP